MAAGSEQKDAAWAFVEYANAMEGQIILAQSGRTVPSRIALAESATFLDPNAKPANSQVFLDAIPGMQHLPIFATWSDIEGIVSTQIENAYYGVETLDEAIETANEQSVEFFPVP